MYTTQAQVEGKLQRKLTTEEALILTTLIGAVSEFIDNYTNRHFEAVPTQPEGSEEATEARYFDVKEASNTLFIDDALKITKVESYDVNLGEVEETIVEPDFTTYPYNKLPITGIRLLNGTCFTPGTKNVKVTGIWGNSETVPDGISAVATYLVSEIYANPEALKAENIEGYAKTFDSMLPPLYMSILDAKTKPMI